MTESEPDGVLVRRAFEALPPTHRSVIELARGGCRYPEIAERLGVSVEVVRTWALHAVLSLTRARTAGVPH